MKNKLSDLNNHLFAQIERLGDEDLLPEGIEKEARRAQAIVSVADQIIANANLQLRAASLMAEYGYDLAPAIEQITPGAKLIERGPR